LLLKLQAALKRFEAGEGGHNKQVIQALDAALRRREGLVRDAATTAWRFVHGQVDGFRGLTVDLYEDAMVLEIHLQSDLGPELERAIACLSLPNLCFVVKDRRRSDIGSKSGRLVLGCPFPTSRVVREEGLQYEVSLMNGEHTGLFLDARGARRFIRKRSKGLRVLNLFCFTGTMGVAAAAGGALSTTNVDLRSTHASRVLRNYALNDLSTDSRTFLKAEAARFLSRSKRSGAQYDLVIVDPPRWARMTEKRRFDVRNGYEPLLRKAMEVVAPCGKVLASNGAGTLEDEALQGVVGGAAASLGRNIARCELIEQDADCPRGSDRPTSRFIWLELD
jgi:23S rRNA (cytosine1962-C5)-methyltransferase